MLNLAEQAADIAAKLTATGLFTQVEYLESTDEALKRPANYPSAQIFLNKADFDEGEGFETLARTYWAVLIKARRFSGSDGSLVLVDAVLDALSGIWLPFAYGPLLPARVEHYDADLGLIASYIVTFLANKSSVALASGEN